MTTDTQSMATAPESLGVLDDPAVRQVTKQDALDTDPAEFEPARIECPVCERTGTTHKNINTCGACGAWFLVEPGEDG